MKNIGSSNPKQLEFKFSFAPALREQGAEAWTPEKMDEVALRLEKQAHQLRTVAKIIRHRRRSLLPSRPRLKWLPRLKAAMN